MLALGLSENRRSFRVGNELRRGCAEGAKIEIFYFSLIYSTLRTII